MEREKTRKMAWTKIKPPSLFKCYLMDGKLSFEEPISFYQPILQHVLGGYIHTQQQSDFYSPLSLGKY